MSAVGRRVLPEALAMKHMTSLALINQTIETMWESIEEVVEMAKDHYEPLAGVFIETICEALPGVSGTAWCGVTNSRWRRC